MTIRAVTIKHKQKSKKFKNKNLIYRAKLK